MSDRLIKILIDSFPKILIPGLRMTIPLTLASFAVGFDTSSCAAVYHFLRIARAGRDARRISGSGDRIWNEPRCL